MNKQAEMKANLSDTELRHLNKIKKCLIFLIFSIAIFTDTTIWAQTAEDYNEEEIYETAAEKMIKDNNNGSILDEQSGLKHYRKRMVEDEDASASINLNLELRDLFSNEKPGLEQPYPKENKPWYNPDEKTGEVGENDPIYHDPPPPPDPPDLSLSTLESNIILILIMALSGWITLISNRKRK